MSVLYTTEEMQAALKELRIKPHAGKITSQEAACVLTWRAKAEQGAEHHYPATAIRQHVRRGNLKVAEALNPRFHLYRIEDVFDLPLVPRRGLSLQKQQTTPGNTGGDV